MDLENHKVLLKDPVGSNKGSRLVMDVVSLGFLDTLFVV